MAGAQQTWNEHGEGTPFYQEEVDDDDDDDDDERKEVLR